MNYKSYKKREFSKVSTTSKSALERKYIEFSESSKVDKNREEIMGVLDTVPKKTTKEYYFSEDYEVYFIEYVGDIKSSVNKLPYADVFQVGSFFAYLFVENGRLNDVLKAVPEIINVQKGFPYTLSELQVSNDYYNNSVLDMGNTSLTGTRVVVGIISTGIDYLNPRFMTADGNSRIVGIWDQTLNESAPIEGFFRGTEFTMKKINEAINLKNQGGDPYSIVNHKDEIGQGTALAGIIGGRKLHPEDVFSSVVPDCNFAVVKLKEAKDNTLKLSGIDKRNIPIYQDSDIEAALRYFLNLHERTKQPMTVYLALGSNSGGHSGDTVLERYINFISERRDFNVVCNTGNQGNAEGHAAGVFNESEEIRIIPVNVDINEENLFFSLYTLKPDKVTIGLTSPTGKFVEMLTIPTNNGESIITNLEDNQITVQYFEEKQSGGDQRVDVLIRNIQGGVWQINLRAKYIMKGKYDLWLLQKEVLEPGTRFLEPDFQTTLMTPSTAQNSITTSYYNEENNAVIVEAGRGFTREGGIKPSVTMGAMNLLTTGLNNTLMVASGAAMAGALLAGAVAMVYQWGIVEGNDPELFPPKLLSYIISAAIRGDGGIYPNEEWGYGRFSFRKLIENLNRIKNKNSMVHSLQEFAIRHLYINIPKEIYERLPHGRSYDNNEK